MMEGISCILSELESVLSRIDEKQCEDLCGRICRAKKIMLNGGGRSGLMARAFAMRLVQLGLDVQIVGDFTATAIGEGDLLISLSASGGTPAVCAAQRKAASLGADTVAITGNADSELAKSCARIVLISGVDSKESFGVSSKQPMGSLFEQSVLLLADAIVMLLMEKTGQSGSNMKARHANLE